MKFTRPLKHPTMVALTILAMVTGVTQPVVAHADPAPPSDTITGVPSLPALPEADNAATQQLIDQGVDMLKSQPLMQNAEKHAANTTAPLDTSSTNPTCAPLIMVGVPGTFETDRAQDPNKPTGLLGSLAAPMREQGGFSETYIPYTADAGVSGTSYAKSVQYGTEKTVNTITDIANRCHGSRIVLTGFSQGADIAGDVATMIGQKQVPVDPAIIAGVVLFADPQRAENSNILVGSSNTVPTMPDVVGKAVEHVISDPSLAQQMIGQQVNLSGLAAHLLTGAQPQQQETSPTPSITEHATSAPQAGQTPSSTSATSAPQAGQETITPTIDLSADEQTLTDTADLTGTLKLQEQVSNLYRSGGCGTDTFATCLKRFTDSGENINDALATTPAVTPEQLATIPRSNIVTSKCINLPATQCSAVAHEQSNLPAVTYLGTVGSTPEDNTEETTPAGPTPTPTNNETEPQPQQSQNNTTETPTAQAEPTTSTPTPQAGQNRAPQTTTPTATAGQTPKKTTSKQPTTSTTPTPAAPQAGDKARPTTSTPYTGTLSGITTTPGRDYTEVPVDPIITSAVAGGGVAGERDKDFGELTGSVVSLCVPGDIVCSLPAHSQLAKDLVEIGQQVSTNLTGAAKATSAGNTAMGGFLALQAVNSIFSLSGLPTINLSAETIEALILIVGGATLLIQGDVTGAGAAMLTSALPLLPKALPEVWQFLQDLPELLDKLKDAPDQLAKNLHIGEIRGSLKNAFESAGLNDVTDLTQIPPQAGLKAASLILQENSGLMELATNPDYLRTGAHSEKGFRDLILTDNNKESFTWSQDYINALDDMID